MEENGRRKWEKMWNGEKRPCSAHCPPDESSSISQRERNCEVRFKKNQLQFIGQRLTFVIDRVHHQLQEEIWPPFRATPFNSTPCNLRREQVTGRRSMTSSLTNPIWFDFSLSLSVSSPTNSKKSFLFLTGKLATRSVTPHWWLKKPKKSEIIYFLTGKLGNAVDDVTLMAQKAKKFKRLLQIRRKLGNVGNAVDDVT